MGKVLIHTSFFEVMNRIKKYFLFRNVALLIQLLLGFITFKNFWSESLLYSNELKLTYQNKKQNKTKQKGLKTQTFKWWSARYRWHYHWCARSTLLDADEMNTESCLVSCTCTCITVSIIMCNKGVWLWDGITVCVYFCTFDFPHTFYIIIPLLYMIYTDYKMSYMFLLYISVKYLGLFAMSNIMQQHPKAILQVKLVFCFNVFVI